MATPLPDNSASLSAWNSLSDDDKEAYATLRTYLNEAEGLSYSDVLSMLDEEREKNQAFNESWCRATALQRYYQVGKHVVLTDEHRTALMCYTLNYPKICWEFNESCRSAPRTESRWNEFPFKSLWCLLVDAFKRLPKFDGESRDFYRGVALKKTLQSRSVYFAQFLSASTSERVASTFTFNRSEGAVLTLESVPVEYVRDIRRFPIYPSHQEVLIWPLCVFKCLNEFGTLFQFQDAEPIREPLPLEPLQLKPRPLYPLSLPLIIPEDLVEICLRYTSARGNSGSEH